MSTLELPGRRSGDFVRGWSGAMLLAITTAAVSIGLISLTFILPLALPGWIYSLLRVHPGIELAGIAIGVAAVALFILVVS